MRMPFHHGLYAAQAAYRLFCTHAIHVHHIGLYKAIVCISHNVVKVEHPVHGERTYAIRKSWL